MAIRNVLLATAAIFASTAAFASSHTEVKAPASVEIKKEEAKPAADKKEVTTETKTEVKKEEVKK